ncbi:MAG: helix-turn-helix domain-containing protein [Treponema sp.]|nr:helix-turn-helix domain-containing protein [Treponema sp.]MBR4386150.1 helix-turn-helix domain-containing protein [Treponema sp.]
MQSYGAILKEKREEKGLSVEQVVKDTSISYQYITGLENEKDDVFPAGAYMVGFLKNYADYLGVSSEDLIRLYHAKKIQESPTPEALLRKTKPKFLVPLIVVGSVVLLGGILAYLYFGVFKVPQKLQERALKNATAKKSNQYLVTDQPQELRLYKGDQLLVPFEEGEGHTPLTISSTLSRLAIETPVGTQVFDLSEERVLDINGDGISELIVYLSDISNVSEKNGAQVRVSLGGSQMIASNPAATENVELVAKPSIGTESVANTSLNTATMKVIHEDSRSYPFTIDFSFRGPCYFRYKIDSNSKVERNFRTGESLTVTSRYKGVRLWMSNAYNVKMKVRAGMDAYDLEVGKAGQVAVEDIKWVQGRDGKFRIVIQDVD